MQFYIEKESPEGGPFLVSAATKVCADLCRAIKTMIGESCDATNQAKVMGYMTAGWGVGTIAGPTIGGLLANPCDSFASGTAFCAPDSWLITRYIACAYAAARSPAAVHRLLQHSHYLHECVHMCFVCRQYVVQLFIALRLLQALVWQHGHYG